MANRYFPGFEEGSDIVETVAGIAAGATDNINNHADENRDTIIGAFAESVKKVLNAIDAHWTVARRKYFNGKAVWFIILMAILAVGFGACLYWVFGQPMFLDPEIDKVTGLATGNMVRNPYSSYLMTPILGFAFWVFFVYMTDLGLPKSK